VSSPPERSSGGVLAKVVAVVVAGVLLIAVVAIVGYLALVLPWMPAYPEEANWQQGCAAGAHGCDPDPGMTGTPVLSPS
jgi:hypothetical protein